MINDAISSVLFRDAASWRAAIDYFYALKSPDGAGYLFVITGPVGCGKTTFVQKMFEAAGCEPTFCAWDEDDIPDMLDAPETIVFDNVSGDVQSVWLTKATSDSNGRVWTIVGTTFKLEHDLMRRAKWIGLV